MTDDALTRILTETALTAEDLEPMLGSLADVDRLLAEVALDPEAVAALVAESLGRT